MRFTHLTRTLATVLAAALLAGCAATPDIRRDVNPDANFAAYRTFGYLSPLATDRGGYESVFTARLKAATRRAMEARGYTYRESNPDLLLNFFANVREKQEIVTTPASVGYYGYRRGMYGGFGVSSVDTITYREGTLTIDVVDAQRKILAWQATAVGTVSEEVRKNPGPAIDAIVADMMSALPPAAGATPAPAPTPAPAK